GLLGAVVYAVFYKHTFNIGCAIAIVVVIITLILGYILNKSSKKGDIESIY
ncbi:aquaporin, partial [Staphylococcus aureus]|nr:aquaporin [Staphylococcus aureus]HBM8140190.1 aquaporin [Staphylococcus aureus]